MLLRSLLSQLVVIITKKRVFVTDREHNSEGRIDLEMEDESRSLPVLGSGAIGLRIADGFLNALQIQNLEER